MLININTDRKVLMTWNEARAWCRAWRRAVFAETLRIRHHNA